MFTICEQEKVSSKKFILTIYLFWLDYIQARDKKTLRKRSKIYDKILEKNGKYLQIKKYNNKPYKRN